jgi:hypothetical protein
MEVEGLNGERIVVLDWEERPPKFCNLIKVARDGTVLWTATPYHPLEGVWSHVSFKDGRLVAYNYSGFEDLIDYDTGRILHRTFAK